MAARDCSGQAASLECSWLVWGRLAWPGVGPGRLCVLRQCRSPQEREAPCRCRCTVLEVASLPVCWVPKVFCQGLPAGRPCWVSRLAGALAWENEPSPKCRLLQVGCPFLAEGGQWREMSFVLCRNAGACPPAWGGRALVGTWAPRWGPRLPSVVTWLILPVVICLSQRLSHACLSINDSIP